MNRPHITLIIASSLDGRIAFPEGGNKNLGSSEDRVVLNKALKNMDATIFGSGTLKAHKSTFLVKDKNGISEKQPISIVAGNIKDFSQNWLYFKQPIIKWSIHSNEIKNDKNLNFQKEFIYQDSWIKTLEILTQEGIKNIALLGGGKLINAFAREDLIDEIKITIVPIMIGGKFTWIPIQQKEKFSSNWTIKSIKRLKTDEIFIHYSKK